MPEVQEVFRIATQKVRPDPGALDRQHRGQRRRTVRRKAAVYAMVAALVGAAALFAVQIGRQPEKRVPAGPPSPPPSATPESVTAGTVTFDGSTCSLELTADPIEPGIVVFEVVNATERPAQFDSWEIAEGYSFGSFEAVLERGLRRLDAGKRGRFPEVGQQILYQHNDSLPAGGSGVAYFTVAPGKEYAITCLQRVPGQRVFSWGPVGPITVG